MELRAFVKTVLSDLDGALSEHLHERAAALMKHGLDPAMAGEMVSLEKDARCGDVVFDVALTVTDSDSTEAGASIKVLGGKMATEKTSELVSRVQFTVRGLPSEGPFLNRLGGMAKEAQKQRAQGVRGRSD